MQFKYQSAIIVCALAYLLFVPSSIAAKKNPAVTEWFRKYDQIRCDAECTTKDKCQMMFLSEHKADKNNAALAERMIKRYTIASSAIKQLRPVPETRELQRGYTEYFGSARVLFTDFLKAENTKPFSTKQLAPAKARLEALDKSNKSLDARLRKEYVIPKHKHI